MSPFAEWRSRSCAFESLANGEKMSDICESRSKRAIPVSTHPVVSCRVEERQLPGSSGECLNVRNEGRKADKNRPRHLVSQNQF